MKNTTNTAFLLYTILLVTLLGCKKDEEELSSATMALVPQNYITSNVNGTLVAATYAAPNTWLVTSVYFHNDHEGQFERFIAPNNYQGWSFYFSNIDLDNITYPKTLKNTTLTSDPYIDITYHHDASLLNGNFVLNELDSTLFNLTFTSWSNNVLEGTFNGDLRWSGNYDSTMTFTNGSFKIQLTRI